MGTFLKHPKIVNQISRSKQSVESVQLKCFMKVVKPKLTGDKGVPEILSKFLENELNFDVPQVGHWPLVVKKVGL